MPSYIFLLCTLGALQNLVVSGNRFPEINENGGKMEYLLGRVVSLEKQHREGSRDMKQQLAELRGINDMQQQRIETLEKLLQEEKMDKGVSDLRVESNTEKALVSGLTRTKAIRQAQVEMSVSFFATMESLNNIGAKHNIEFEHVITNNGSAYNPQTGVFLAPVTGTYVFSTTVTVNGHSNTHVGFMRNGVGITVMNLNGGEKQYDSSSETIVLQLNKGDEVTVQNLDAGASLYGGHHTIFSGFLLYI